MTNILKKGMVLVLIYSLLLIYLFYASNRIETLDKTYNEETIPVAVNINR